MTKPLFFDTDCMCAFLWVKEECLLVKMYPGRIVVPSMVYEEIKRVPHLKKRVDLLLSKNQATLVTFNDGTREFLDYVMMTCAPEDGYKIIGKGEAAAISLAKNREGILASNNFKDIRHYIDKYQLPYTTSADIMVEALEQGLITEAEGNVLWGEMIGRQRKLPTDTFSEYLNNNKRTV